VHRAGGGLPGKANGIDTRGDALQIAPKRSFQSPAPNSGGHCSSTLVGVACVWVGGCHASASRLTRMDASAIGSPLPSSTDSGNLLQSRSCVRNPTASSPTTTYRVRPAGRWPAQAIGPSPVARDTLQPRPGHSEVACPSRRRHSRTCQVDRPVALATTRRRFGKCQLCGIVFAGQARRQPSLVPRFATYWCLGSTGGQLESRQRARRARCLPASRALGGE
jgi:hypothetical protein